MNKSAILVVDCWDKHWDKSSQVSLDIGCPKINKFLNRMRDEGSLIIHCTSDVSDNIHYVEEKYSMKELDKFSIEKDLKNRRFPLMLNADGSKVWKNQHPSIEVKDKDFVTTRGNQIYNIIKQNNIEVLYYVGYHANICLLWTRPFSIIQMKNNFDGDIYLVEDLTDWLGVNKKEEIKMGLEFYNKFVCKTIKSSQIYN